MLGDEAFIKNCKVLEHLSLYHKYRIKEPRWRLTPRSLEMKISPTGLMGSPKGRTKWVLKTGDPLIQIHLYCILVKGRRKGGCLRQVIPY